MKRLHTVCYSSKSDPKLGEGAIQALFDQVTDTNNDMNITGILLHSFGNFFQVLEGDRDRVLHMFTEKIMNDRRHTNVFEVFNRPSPKPVFTGYSSGFTTVRTQGQLDGVREYLNSHRSDPTSEKVSRLIMPFILFGVGHGHEGAHSFP